MQIFLLLPPEVPDLLDLLRSASLDVVEAIQSWRVARKNTAAPYLWNKENYLVNLMITITIILRIVFILPITLAYP